MLAVVGPVIFLLVQETVWTFLTWFVATHFEDPSMTGVYRASVLTVRMTWLGACGYLVRQSLNSSFFMYGCSTPSSDKAFLLASCYHCVGVFVWSFTRFQRLYSAVMSVLYWLCVVANLQNPVIVLLGVDLIAEMWTTTWLFCRELKY